MDSKELQAFKRLISWAYAQVCEHEDTYRGGAIWEICRQCGRKWADDQGGRPEFKWPEEITDAEQALHSLQQAEPLPAGQWVKTSERLPTLGDADNNSHVWMSDGKTVWDDWWAVMEEEDAPPYWMAKTDPEPPTERE